MYISGTLLLAVIGTTKLILGLIGNNEIAGLAGLAAFNLFMIEPIKSPIIK